MKIFYFLLRFLCYNADWVGWALGLEQFQTGTPPKLRPWNSSPTPPPKPALIMRQIGSVTFDSLMERQLDWAGLCEHVISSNNKPVLAKLLHLRPAFNQAEAPYLPKAELEANWEVKDFICKKL